MLLITNWSEMTARAPMVKCTLETGEIKLQYRKGMTKVTTQFAVKDFSTTASYITTHFVFFYLII